MGTSVACCSTSDDIEALTNIGRQPIEGEVVCVSDDDEPVKGIEQTKDVEDLNRNEEEQKAVEDKDQGDLPPIEDEADDQNDAAGDDDGFTEIDRPHEISS